MAGGSIKLIVGLGNPGPEYQKTRHNAGDWFVRALANQAGVDLVFQKKFNALFTRADLFGHDCFLMIPLNFMNLSGDSIRAVAQFYKLSPEEILIAHDDLDLQPGTARWKKDGGHGGHNGIRDSIAKLGGAHFYRLRLGIGHPGQSHQVTNYVLGRANKADQQHIEQAIDNAMISLPQLLDGNLSAAMNGLH
jgi:peptidyl-tRNA hydrolase, PTH1 family